MQRGQSAPARTDRRRGRRPDRIQRKLVPRRRDRTRAPNNGERTPTPRSSTQTRGRARTNDSRSSTICTSRWTTANSSSGISRSSASQMIASFGAEALIRWNHPRRGVVSPTAFIPLAEDTGLIVDIGAWALNEASAQLRSWSDADPVMAVLGVSVNLSVKQLRSTDIVNTVTRTLDRTGITPGRLTVEMTESVFADDLEAIHDVLDELRRAGVRTAIDDFGTGYSSLAYLKHLPIDTLKIDKTFVDGLGTDARDDDDHREHADRRHRAEPFHRRRRGRNGRAARGASPHGMLRRPRVLRVETGQTCRPCVTRHAARPRDRARQPRPRFHDQHDRILRRRADGGARRRRVRCSGSRPRAMPELSPRGSSATSEASSSRPAPTVPTPSRPISPLATAHPRSPLRLPAARPSTRSSITTSRPSSPTPARYSSSAAERSGSSKPPRAMCSPAFRTAA